MEYEVREVLRVTAEDLTTVINEAAREGWSLERVDYVREPGVRRPQMAFLFFVRDTREDDE